MLPGKRGRVIALNALQLEVSVRHSVYPYSINDDKNLISWSPSVNPVCPPDRARTST